jgi:hypothetical protein
MGHAEFLCWSKRIGNSNGKGKSNDKSEMRGSLHYAGHDEAVTCFGRDDGFWRGERTGNGKCTGKSRLRILLEEGFVGGDLLEGEGLHVGAGLVGVVPLDEPLEGGFEVEVRGPVEVGVGAGGV